MRSDLLEGETGHRGHATSALGEERLVVQLPPLRRESVGLVLLRQGLGTVRLGELALISGSVSCGWVIGDLDVVFPLDKREVGDLIYGPQLCLFRSS